MTPEGRVKKNIKRILDSFGVYYLMPVQHGIGPAGLDFHCVVQHCDLAIAFFIEAKKPGDGPTGRQDNFIKERKEKQNARTFVIDEDPSINKGSGIEELTQWLAEIEADNERYDQPQRGRAFLETNL